MQPERIGCGRGRLCSAVATILGLPRFSPTSVPLGCSRFGESPSLPPGFAEAAPAGGRRSHPRPPGGGHPNFVRRHGGVTLRRRPSMNKASLARPREKGGRIWGGNHD